MRKSGLIGTKFGSIETQTWVDFLTRRHPVKTARHVAAAIGAPESTCKKWLEGDALPGMIWFCRLVAAYGPEFLAACLPGCDWLSDAACAARRDRLDAELQNIERELLTLDHSHNGKTLETSGGR
jgi:hypothetical protein